MCASASGSQPPAATLPHGEGSPAWRSAPQAGTTCDSDDLRKRLWQEEELEEAAGSPGLGLGRKAVRAAGGDESQGRGRGDAAAGRAPGLEWGEELPGEPGSSGGQTGRWTSGWVEKLRGCRASLKGWETSERGRSP